MGNDSIFRKVPLGKTQSVEAVTSKCLESAPLPKSRFATAGRSTAPSVFFSLQSAPITSEVNSYSSHSFRLDTGICSLPLFRYWDRDLPFSLNYGVFLMVYFLPPGKGAMFQIVNNETQMDH
jgi:hypothetical protein